MDPKSPKNTFSSVSGGEEAPAKKVEVAAPPRAAVAAE